MIILYTTTCMASIWSIYTTHIFHLDHLFYDYLWALAVVLDRLSQRDLDLTQFHYGNTSLLNMVLEKFYRLDFEGVSGRIKFNNNSGFLTRPSSVFQVVNSTAQLVAIYDDNGLTMLTSIEFIPDSFPRPIHEYISCMCTTPCSFYCSYTVSAHSTNNIPHTDYQVQTWPISVTVKASSLKLNQHWTVPLYSHLQSHAYIANFGYELFDDQVTVVMCNLLCMYMGLALPHFCHVDFRDSGC